MNNLIEEIKLEAKRKANIVKHWLNSPEGEEIFGFLEEEFADRTSHVIGDPYTTAYNEGQRSVVLFLKDVGESEYE